MTTTFAEAVKAFEKTQEAWVEFGAWDTEPSTVFAYLIRQLHDGKEPEVPATVRDWQLFSGMKGNGLAAAALTRAARKVIEAGKVDHMGVVRYAKTELWRA
jgi:hypothetical protein